MKYFFDEGIQSDATNNGGRCRKGRFDKPGIVGHLSRACGPCKTAPAATLHNLSRQMGPSPTGDAAHYVRL
jgi:hypothetical protein